MQIGLGRNISLVTNNISYSIMNQLKTLTQAVITNGILDSNLYSDLVIAFNELKQNMEEEGIKIGAYKITHAFIGSTPDESYPYDTDTKVIQDALAKLLLNFNIEPYVSDEK
jgi:hypothetical protein